MQQVVVAIAPQQQNNVALGLQQPHQQQPLRVRVRLHFTRLDQNMLHSAILNFIITSVRVYEFLQLINDGLRSIAYILLGVYMTFKFIAFIYFLIRRDQSTSLAGFIVMSMVSSEWLASVRNEFDSEIFATISIVQLTLPTFIVNTCLLGWPNRFTESLSHGYYEFLLIFDAIVLSFAVFLTLESRRNVRNQHYIQQIKKATCSIPLQLLPEFSIAFCFWYVVAQSFVESIIIGCAILTVNLIAFLLVVALRENRKETMYGYFNFARYVLHFPCEMLSLYVPRNNDFMLRSTNELAAHAFQLVTLIVILALKLGLFIEVEEAVLDYVLYACCALVIPIQIAMLVVNVKAKLTKRNRAALECRSGQLAEIENIAKQYIVDPYIIDFSLIVNVGRTSGTAANKRGDRLRQLSRLRNLVHGYMKQAMPVSLMRREIEVRDDAQKIKIKFVNDPLNGNRIVQQLKFSEKYEEMHDQAFVVDMMMLLASTTDIQSSSFIEVELIRSQIPRFRKVLLEAAGPVYVRCKFVPEQETPDEGQLEREGIIANIHREVAALSLHAVAFYKYITPFLPINPALAFYDLQEEC